MVSDYNQGFFYKILIHNFSVNFLFFFFFTLADR